MNLTILNHKHQKGCCVLQQPFSEKGNDPMPELTDLSVIRALCEKYDFALSKGFGQNFIQYVRYII